MAVDRERALSSEKTRRRKRASHGEKTNYKERAIAFE
jgi:hypothetical protein